MCRLVRRTLMSLPKLVRCSTSMMESTLFLFRDSFQHPKVNFPREAERCEKLEHTLRSPKDETTTSVCHSKGTAPDLHGPKLLPHPSVCYGPLRLQPSGPLGTCLLPQKTPGTTKPESSPSSACWPPSLPVSTNGFLGFHHDRHQ